MSIRINEFEIPTLPKKEEWEKKFEEFLKDKRNWSIMGEFNVGILPKTIKSFISKLLKEAYRNGQHSMIPKTPEKTIKLLKKKGLLD